ncbi:DUF234 domain-containing protein [Acidianus sp. HS-5]|uniref:DUF234 domain-containing protein n=1 Tax=Acidianus sp. HS-5 TaxID=2886040 RepID=UPI001F15E10F|nr:DUF234 domain-containing protein [Acidianus sp. HS-5]BDC18895.1 hypothetical protein HS5_17850 [Acidianus sp. HS-5]
MRELIKEKILVDLPFNYVGKYVHKGEEVNIIAEGDDVIFLGEVKWSNNVDANELVVKMRRIMAKINDKGKKEYYGAFAKSFRRCE